MSASSNLFQSLGGIYNQPKRDINLIASKIISILLFTIPQIVLLRFFDRHQQNRFCFFSRKPKNHKILCASISWKMAFSSIKLKPLFKEETFIAAYCRYAHILIFSDISRIEPLHFVFTAQIFCFPVVLSIRPSIPDLLILRTLTLVVTFFASMIARQLKKYFFADHNRM